MRSPAEHLARMLLIRRFEEELLQLHERGLMLCHFHVSIGQESTAVATCSNLMNDDVIYTNHRSNGHLLARGADPGEMFAEQLGRVGGNTGGKGGTLHMIAPELGIPWTSSLVGSSVPLAVGTALFKKHSGGAGIVVAFFGDGVLEEGAFYEAINLATLWQVPILFVCENNGVPAGRRSFETAESQTLRVERLRDVAAIFQVPNSVVDGCEFCRTERVISEAIEAVRRGRSPYFVEVRTTRYPGNATFWPHLAGAITSVEWSWDRSTIPDKLFEWSTRSDPILRFIETMLERGLLTEQNVREVDRSVAAQLEVAVEFAVCSPEPELQTAYDKVWAS